MDIYRTNNNNILYTFTKIDNKQIELLKKEIKKAYMQILKIKYDEIFENCFVPSDEKIEEYEKYRKFA